MCHWADLHTTADAEKEEATRIAQINFIIKSVAVMVYVWRLIWIGKGPTEFWIIVGIRFKAMVLAFKAINGTAPVYLQTLVRPHAPAQALRFTRSAGRLALPSLRADNPPPHPHRPTGCTQ